MMATKLPRTQMRQRHMKRKKLKIQNVLSTNVVQSIMSIGRNLVIRPVQELGKKLQPYGVKFIWRELLLLSDSVKNWATKYRLILNLKMTKIRISLMKVFTKR